MNEMKIRIRRKKKHLHIVSMYKHGQKQQAYVEGIKVVRSPFTWNISE